MAPKASNTMLYDDRAEIDAQRLEKILQGVVWLADRIILPEHAQAEMLAGGEEREMVERKLAELAEAGLVQRWRFDPPLSQVSLPRWWPATSKTHLVDASMYSALQRAIRSGVSLYRDELLRGGGRPGGTMVSGVSEIVSLQRSLWTIGLAQQLGAESLLSSDLRSTALCRPVRQLADLGRLAGPVTKTLMELNDIGPLSSLTSRDILRLRKFKPAVRSVIAEIIQNVGRTDVLSSLEFQRYVDGAVDETRRYHADLLGVTVKRMRRRSVVTNIAGAGLTIAGIVIPPLASLSFVQPLLSLNVRGGPGRKLCMFLSKLKSRTSRRDARR